MQVPAEAAAYLPAGQLTHWPSAVAPVDPWALPAAHPLQLEAPVVSWYTPVPQVSHEALAVEAWYWPVGHDAHAVAPDTAV